MLSLFCLLISWIEDHELKKGKLHKLQNANSFLPPFMKFKRFFSSKPKNVEIEVKFAFDKAKEEKIKSMCSFMGEKKMRDVYYDHPTKYFLSKKDIWLRERNEEWECKVDFHFYQSLLQETDASLHKTGEASGYDNYKELGGEEEINFFLSKWRLVERGGSLEETLKRNFIKPFCCIESVRSKYLYRGEEGSITIDLDSTDFGYNIGEIEVMVEKESEIELAEKKIGRFSRLASIDLKSGVNGKVLEYIRKYNPPHFEALRECGLLERKGAKY